MELNKIAAAVLLAGLIAMATGKVSTILYYGGNEPGAHHGGEEHAVKRGFVIEGAEAFAAGAGGGAAAKTEKVLASIIPFLHSADVTAGEAYFKKKCSTCHTGEQGGKNKTGPNLWGIVNRPKGSKSDFKYSKAVTSAGGKWEFEDLNGFLHKPKKFMPGTIMGFAGIKKDQDRGNLIAYLRTLNSSPVAIPAAPKVEAPAAEDAAPAEAAN